MLNEIFSVAMLRILNDVIVYVNVTWVIFSRHDENIEWGNVYVKKNFCYTR
jgi:hypothetical protein